MEKSYRFSTLSDFYYAMGLDSNGKKIKNLTRKMFYNADDLSVGDCMCLIQNKNTGKVRLGKGSVALIPYAKNATSEVKSKYGKSCLCYLP